MKTTIIRVSLFILFSSLLSCSRINESEILETSDKFFSFIDQKDYKAAYELLSKKDKEVMDADSFFIFCHKTENVEKSKISEYLIDLIEEMQEVSTHIQRNNGGYHVSRIQRLPDIKLINETNDKPDDPVSFFKTYNELKTQGKIPTMVDSSRTIRVLKEKGNPVVSIGLPEYAVYISLMNNIIEKDLSTIRIDPIRLEIDGKYADFTYDIKNNNKFELEMVSCRMFVDDKLINDSVLLLDNIPAHSKKTITEFILFEYNVESALKSNFIWGNQIKIIPDYVSFVGEYYNEKHQILMKESGFDGFTFSKLTALQSLLEKLFN